MRTNSSTRCINVPNCLLWLGLTLCAVLFRPAVSWGDVDLTFEITNPGDFTATQLDALISAIDETESLWEGQITGYQPGITQTILPITVRGTSTGFGLASLTGTVGRGGFVISTGGNMSISFDAIDLLMDFQGNGINTVDELVAHETGHILGIGSLWTQNGVYVNGTGRYTGEHGLAAYRTEFDPSATFVPVELAGAAGTRNKHWDQLMRSSSQEGNPDDPFSLSPLLGITDGQGRDLALELMTGAIDPDYGEPFLSPMTVQSLRDLGFTVIPEPNTGRLFMLAALIAIFSRRTADKFLLDHVAIGPSVS